MDAGDENGDSSTKSNRLVLKLKYLSMVSHEVSGASYYWCLDNASRRMISGAY